MKCFFDEIRNKMNEILSLHKKRANEANKNEKVKITKEMTALKDSLFKDINAQIDAVLKDNNMYKTSKEEAIKSLEIFKRALNKNTYPINSDTLNKYSGYTILKSKPYRNYYETKLAKIEKDGDKYILDRKLLYTDIDGNEIVIANTSPLVLNNLNELKNIVHYDVNIPEEEINKVSKALYEYSLKKLDNSEINKIIKDIYINNDSERIRQLYKPKNESKFGLFDFEYKPITKLVEKLVKNDDSFDKEFDRFVEKLPSGIRQSIKKDKKSKEHFIGSKIVLQIKSSNNWKI